LSHRERRRLHEYLEDVLDAVDRIQDYVRGISYEMLGENRMIQDAVSHNFEVIGEALHQLADRYPDFRDTHPEIPFQSAYSMRNKLAHLYWQTEDEILWETITMDLIPLRISVEVALESLR
jgi:uncharacterized protein with HEPN domain